MDDFAELYNFLLELGRENIMLIGDCNARVGSSQLLQVEPEFMPASICDERSACDTTVDSKGRKFIEMCETIGLTLLNGRMPSDKNGNFTFIRGTSCSTIDYCLIRGRWLDCVDDLSVEELVYSDHLPLNVKCKFSELQGERNEGLKLLPKLKWKGTLLASYQMNLDLCINTLSDDQIKSTRGIDLLVSSISQTAQTFQSRRMQNWKDPWFDAECEAARKKSFGFLKLLRATNSMSAKSRYQEANKAFKTICKEKKNQYSRSLMQRLSEVRDSRAFWKLVRELNGIPFARKTEISITILAEHFERLLSVSGSPNQMQFAYPWVGNDYLDRAFTTQEITDVLNRCSINKAPGEDRVPYEFYKYASENFITKLTDAFNYIFDSCEIPQNFRKNIIFPLFKKGDVNDPNNYRGISFLNAVMKIFTGVILDRLTLWTQEHNLLSEFQAGFRKEYSTVDNIFSLTSIANSYISKGKKLYAFFIDFKAAFDSINRIALFYKLSCLGLSSKMLTIIRRLYEDNLSAVWDGAERSDWFQTTSGVKQGCLLSPLLFSLFLDDLTSFLPGGISFAGTDIKALLYADDIVIFAETPNMLQIMINKLQLYCQLWSLTVNTRKSKVMIFRNGTGRYARDEKWKWECEELDVVREYKYLGIIITPQLSFKKHLQEKLKEAKKAINCNWNGVLGKKHIAPSAKYKLFEAVMRSVMCYAGQVWGINQHEEVEKLLRYFIKKIFWLPENTPTYMLHLETGVAPLYVFTLKMHLYYISKIIALPNHRLPNKIVRHLLSQKSQFFEEWTRLGTQHEVQLLENNLESWKDSFPTLLEKIEVSMFAEFEELAHRSESRNMYKLLQYNLGENNYFNDRFSISLISSIFKTRGELLRLNYQPYGPEGSIECSLCNLRATENVLHFLGTCPILKTIRRAHWGKWLLTLEETKDILNGQNWTNLYSFVKAAYNYRMQIINEAF